MEDDGTRAELQALDEAFDREHRKPRAKVKRSKRAESELFDVKRWRLPTRWRNDKRVGDSVMAKMLAGVDPDRFERLAR